MDKSDLNKQIEEELKRGHPRKMEGDWREKTEEELESEKFGAPDNVHYYGPKFVVRDEEHPEDSYAISVVGGKVVATPDNKSAHRRTEIKKLLGDNVDI